MILPIFILISYQIKSTELLDLLFIGVSKTIIFGTIEYRAIFVIFLSKTSPKTHNKNYIPYTYVYGTVNA